ncbi:serine-threonine/tyrosine-protein kinase catalytic domain-containing protein [Tanacetum coccineum]
MHCEKGGWPVLAFMLAALLLCGKQYNGEQKTLEMVYKQAPKELLHLLTPLNPQPSQLRYLQYLSRRNLGSDWPPSDTPLALDCIILRFLPYFGKKGCRPVIRIYGQDSTLTTANRSSKLLFSSSKSKKHARNYRQEERKLLIIDVNLCVQGDVVLECIHLDHVNEEMMFRVMFHTAFVRSSILSFIRDEVDGMWDAKGQMAENFRAEVLFSDTIEGESEDVNVEESNKYEEFFEEEEIFKVAEMQHTLLPVESRITSENGDADAGAFKNCTSDDENHKPYTKINDLDHVNGGLNPKGAVANEDGNKTDGRGVKLEEVRSKLDIEEDAGKILSRNNLLDKGSTSRPKEWQHLRISFKEIEVATKNFQDCIGKGGYGLVYKGTLYKTGKSIPIAIKRLNEQFGQGLKEFLNEVNLLTGKKHPNLISLLGYCEEDKEKILVYEYAQRGSLDKYLRRKNTTNYTLTWNQRLKICVGAARGLEHLHYHVGEHLSIIHRDIKSANILLDENWVAKVSDFGLSKLTFAGLNRITIVSLACGTMSYIEPEYMVTGIVKKKSDVYSFGMVLFEVLCGRLCAIKDDDGILLSGPLAIQLYERKRLDEIVDPSLKEHLNSDSMNKFSTIAYRCLHFDRRHRPTMDLVVKELEDLLKIKE